MKNRDNFIDLMEEINVRHLDEHIKKNTDSKTKRIKRYIAAVGIYAAACIAVLLLIPFIINHTVDVPPHTPPGAEPVTTEPAAEDNERNIDEVLSDTILYKVMNAAGVDRKDVDRLRAGREQVVYGSVYYQRGSEIFRDNEPHFIMSSYKDMGEFRVGNDCIYYTELPNCESPVQKNLYCYNLTTKEEKNICNDEILFFDIVDNELVYVTGDSRNPTEYKVYNYVNYSEESRLISTIPAEQNSVSSAYFNGHQLVVLEAYVNYESPSLMIYDIHKGEWKVMVSGANETRIAFADTGDGYYCSVELLAPYGDFTIVAKRYNGVWFQNPDTEEKELISGTTYSELYYVNGALVGVNGNEATVIIEKPTVEEKYGLEEGKIFPRPEAIIISCKYDHRQLTSGDALYEYFYEKINARVKDGKLQELTDRNHASPNKYRGDNEVYVEFKYSGDSNGAPFYPDKENSDTVFTPGHLFFPLTGDNTDTVLFNHRNESGELATLCYGTLAEDPEIEAKIWEFFSYAVPETTSPVTDIESILEDYTVHRMPSSDIEAFIKSIPRDYLLGNIAVEVTDYDGLYLLVDDDEDLQLPTHQRANIHRIIYKDTIRDCDIPFYYGDIGYTLLKTDEYVIVGKNATDDSHYYIFTDDGCVYVPKGSGRDGSSPLLYVENDELKYRTTNSKYVWVQQVYAMLEVIESEEDWYIERGNVTVDDGNANFIKTYEQLNHEHYDYRKLFDDVRSGIITEYTLPDHLDNIKTFDELMAYNKLKAEIGEGNAMLTLMPVYNGDYDKIVNSTFDEIGATEYKKYAAGEEFNKYYAIKYDTYTLVGKVITESDLSPGYERALVRIVFSDGRSSILSEEHSCGREFRWYKTDDFVCISMGGLTVKYVLYIYDNTCELHNGESVFSDGNFNYMSYEGGEVVYNASSEVYLNFRSNPDHVIDADTVMYEIGTVQLVDGHIEYVPKKSYTIKEWYETAYDYREKSGCETAEKFLQWYVEYYTSGNWKTDPDYIQLP